MSNRIERLLDALRQKMLEAAIQGRLLPQNPDDEPASVLLERIAEEKEKLIRERKIKRPKSTSRIYRRDGHFYESINGGGATCIDGEIPFEIPNSWMWARIGNVFTLQAGKNISPGEIQGGCFENSYPCYGGNGIRGYVRAYNRDGAFPIIGRQGALCGNVNLARGRFYATEHAVCVETYGNVDVEWASSALKALNLNQYATATAQPGLSVTVINEVLIPLPPFAEQQRIVAEIERWFSLIDQIEQGKSDLQTTIKQAKSKILDLAIHGKLVPQDPNDEPASELLKHIAAAKEKLIREKKIKRPKSTSRIYRHDGHFYESINGGAPVCIDDQIPFEIPDSWEWTRLGYVFSLFSTGPFGSMVHKSDYTDSLSGIPLINPTNIKNGCISRGGLQRVRKEKSESLSSYRLSEGDIIIARRGDLSKCAIVTKKEEQWLCGTGSFFLHLSFIVNEYFCYFYASSYTQSMLLGESVGTTMVNLNQKLLNDLLFPLPPLAEQHRIVQKREQLFSYLDDIQNALEV